MDMTLACLPGPRAWPLLGNLPQLELRRMHVQLERWTREHGPSYRIRLGRRDALVVAKPDAIARILRERPDGWRRLESMQAVIREIGAHGVFSAEGDDWRRQPRVRLRGPAAAGPAVGPGARVGSEPATAVHAAVEHLRRVSRPAVHYRERRICRPSRHAPGDAG